MNEFTERSEVVTLAGWLVGIGWAILIATFFLPDNSSWLLPMLWSDLGFFIAGGLIALYKFFQLLR